MSSSEFPGRAKAGLRRGRKQAESHVWDIPFVTIRLLSPAPLSCLCAALRAARPAQPVARERRLALSNQHAEATEIAARRSIADCFFAAFFRAPAAGRLRASNPQIAARNPRFPQGVARGEPEESAFPLPVSRKSSVFYRSVTRSRPRRRSARRPRGRRYNPFCRF